MAPKAPWVSARITRIGWGERSEPPTQLLERLRWNVGVRELTPSYANWKINGADIRRHTLKVPSAETQDFLLAEIARPGSAHRELVIRKEFTERMKLFVLRGFMENIP